MSRILFANNATTTLAGAITNVATTAALQTGAGALFPAPSSGQYFCMTFVDAATGLLNEIVHVTNVTGDVITMVRGQEGTTALSWLSGDHASNWITAAALAAMAQAPDTQAQAGNYVIDTSVTANTITAALAPALTAYVVGTPMRIKLANTNSSGTVTVNVNGLGALTVIAPGGSAPAIGALASGTIATFTYDGTYAQVSSGLASTSVVGTQIYMGTSGGAANVQTFTPSPSISSYTSGSIEYVGVAGYTNTGALTVNVSGIGAVNVYKDSPSGAVALAGGEWVVGNIVSMRYNGSQMVFLNPLFTPINNVWTGQQTPGSQTLTDGSSIAWNANLGQVAYVTTAAARTFASPSGLITSTSYRLEIYTGGYTPAWNSIFKFPASGGVPTGLSGTCIFDFFYDGTYLNCIGQNVTES